MTKKILLGCLAVAFYAVTFAQCDPDRYQTDLFSTVTKTVVTYSTNNGETLEMDIYIPDGDTHTDRPFILWAHGGTFIAGSSTNSTMVEMSEFYARKGYVCASMNYRLASVWDLGDSTNMIEEVIFAISDAKAAMRFMAVNASTYGIDTDNMFMGGNSAGAVMAAHLLYFNDISLADPHVAAIVNAEGGIDGNSGMPGVNETSDIATPEIKAAINLAGAIKQLNFLEVGSKPMISFHGEDDTTVPYNCGKPVNGAIDVQLCGSNSMKTQNDAMGNDNPFTSFPNEGHVPWDGNSAMMTQVQTGITDFLYSRFTGCSVGINTVQLDGSNIYPNPSNDMITVDLPEFESTAIISVYNTMGQTIYTAQSNTTQAQLNKSDIGTGMFLISIETGKNVYQSKIVFN